MTSSFYIRSRKTAERLLNKFGQSETLYSTSGSPSYTVKAVFLPLKKSSSSEKDEQIEVNLENRERSRIIIFSTTDLSIRSGWYISKNSSVKYTIVDVNNIKPTDTQIYYDCIGEK